MHNIALLAAAVIKQWQEDGRPQVAVNLDLWEDIISLHVEIDRNKHEVNRPQLHQGGVDEC